MGNGGQLLRSFQIKRTDIIVPYTQLEYDFASEPFDMFDVEIRACTVIGCGPASSKVRAGWLKFFHMTQICELRLNNTLMIFLKIG